MDKLICHKCKGGAAVLKTDMKVERGGKTWSMSIDLCERCFAEKIVLEPIFIPYCCHTSHEVVSILESIYNEVKGDKLDFLIAVRKSEDPRLQMNNFAIDVLYAFTEKMDRVYKFSDKLYIERQKLREREKELGELIKEIIELKEKSHE